MMSNVESYASVFTYMYVQRVTAIPRMPPPFHTSTKPLGLQYLGNTPVPTRTHPVV